MAEYGLIETPAYAPPPHAGNGHAPIMPPDRDDQPTTQTVQAAAEGVVQAEGDLLTFFGERFRLADGVSIMPMLGFANAASRGVDSSDVKGLAAMYKLIRSVIHRPPLFDENGVRVIDELTGKPAYDETEWSRFEELAIDEGADDEDLMDFVNRAMEVMSARPRRRREISSGGSPQTSEKSRASSFSPGRPPQADGLIAVSDLGR